MAGFGFKVSVVQLGRPDDNLKTFGESYLCSGALGGVAVSGWGGFTFWRLLEVLCGGEV